MTRVLDPYQRTRKRSFFRSARTLLNCEVHTDSGRATDELFALLISVQEPGPAEHSAAGAGELRPAGQVSG